MTASELLSFLRRQGVSLSAVGGRLRIDAPKGMMTSDLRSRLVEKKAEIISLLEQRPGVDSTVMPIRRRPETGPLPVSYAQQGMWFLDQVADGSPIGNVYAAFRFHGSLNIPTLKRCFDEIIRRHETLRSVYKLVDGQLVQIVSESLAVPMRIVDINYIAETNRKEEAIKLATTEARRSFDLSTGPIIRLLLIRLDEDDNLLVTTIHHIACDGWSAGVFFNELMTLYKAFSKGQESPLIDPPIQYHDYASWQREWLTGEILDRLSTYWRKQLNREPSMLKLPGDRSRPQQISFRGSHEPFQFSEELTRMVKEFSRQEGFTIFMTLLTAFATQIYCYSGEDDILIGNNTANRNRREFEELIGPFVNTLVLRIDLSGNPAFRELLGRVREMAIAAYEHRDLPFEKLVQVVWPKWNPARAPYFQVGFSMGNWPEPQLKLAGVETERVSIDQGMARANLILLIGERAGKLSGVVEYSSDLFDAPTIAEILIDLQVIIGRMMADPDETIQSIRATINTEALRRRRNRYKAKSASANQLSQIHQISDQDVDRMLNELLLSEGS